MAPRAFITGLAGLTISANERAFLREARPWGLIIFKRNVNTPEQVSEITQSFRDTVGWQAPVLVDQEGGRRIGRSIRRARAMASFTTGNPRSGLPPPAWPAT